MSAPSPQVSFIIPAYKAATTLRRTAESLTAQTVADWEAIIVDDGSPDRTGRVADAIASEDSRFRVVRQENAGPSAARNRGLANAKAAKVAFLDADDWIAPDFLAKLAPLVTGPRTLAYCAYERVLPSGASCLHDFCARLETDPLSVLLHRCEPAIHCVVAWTETVRRVGEFDEDLRCCEDWDLWLRLARAGCQFIGVNEPLAFYRMRPASLSTGDEVGEQAANLVMRRARLADLRLPPDAPYWGPVPAATGDIERTHALARELCLTDAGHSPSGQWLRVETEQWRAIAARDPEALASFAFHELPAEGGFTINESAMLQVLEVLNSVDPVIGARFAEGFDLYRAKRGAGVFGRYLSITLDGQTIPDVIQPLPGVDVLVLRLLEDSGDERLIMLPLDEPVTRADIVGSLLSTLPISLLIRHHGAYRRPAFWLFAIWTLACAFASAPGAFVGNGRAQLARALRAGTAGALRAVQSPEPPPPPRAIDVPILLIPQIVANDSALLDETIGSAQLTVLFAHLAAEGYEGVSLQHIMRMRQATPPRPARLFAAVFLDHKSARSSGILDDLPRPLRSADVLLDPEEITARAQDAMTACKDVGGRISYGLLIEALPSDSKAALFRARDLLGRLRALNGGAGSVPVLSARHGLDDAILRKAGFGPILSPASVPVRLSNHAMVFPAIECCGAEALGTVIECLRAA